MSNMKPFDPERLDKDNPEWTRADMANALPASEVLPGLIGAKATENCCGAARAAPRRNSAR
jgi:hypothetical protein